MLSPVRPPRNPDVTLPKAHTGLRKGDTRCPFPKKAFVERQKKGVESTDLSKVILRKD